MDTEVTTNSAGFGVSRVGFTQHDTTSLDSIQAFPDHGNDRARSHILDKSREEGASSQISIVFLQQLFSGLSRLSEG